MKAKLLEEVQHLPVRERIELAEAIWDTVAEDAAPEQVPVSAAHRAELDRRLADLEATPDTGRPWKEVRGR
jgi:putative addiction module component (TIGR02574 family)